ncbi:hypothetical protein NEUTE1DRAFT_53743 [Neurospora tetrasperma FGSC 2508]|uniref:Uncharacterized protein n=2 Tax=Neurospora TaxID=5140 RepID=A0AAJ0I399_9PEZI|nr:uncharacterized protein NEUTE1DRAFT_53743 [Neurospora tetrasperma FGSC 2508]EGO52941.1 hypothetical protein NEUTE1DRAFT_53743 [Neurospora tetrasperma FGSC 2508]EGZ77779.1 hypothetical protein NEUTE2DRAFT_50569 [Neurospora tetrasperma FGSC 2509]KAK3488737.1 hypothetical protein B0T23DRAFT_406046 [Neurospora hispaniola]
MGAAMRCLDGAMAGQCQHYSINDYGLRNTLEGTVGSSCPVRRDLHAWRLLNLQPLAALAGRPQQWHNLGNTPLRDGRQVGSQDARRIENGV